MYVQNQDMYVQNQNHALLFKIKLYDIKHNSSASNIVREGLKSGDIN